MTRHLADDELAFTSRSRLSRRPVPLSVEQRQNDCGRGLDNASPVSTNGGSSKVDARDSTVEKSNLHGAGPGDVGRPGDPGGPEGAAVVVDGADWGEPQDRGPIAYCRAHSTILNTILTIVLGGLIWQLVTPHVSKLVAVPLGTIWDSLTKSVSDGSLWINLGASMAGFGAGFAIAAVVGILIGVIMSVSKIAHDFLDPWVSALYSTPLIALAPLYITFFGIGMTVRIAVVTTEAIFPIILNTAAGIRTADPRLIETATAFGGNRFQIFRKVLIPSAVPFVITGLRLAVGRGLTGVVVAEFFGSSNGLGHAVFAASESFDTGAVWAGVIELAIIGVILIRVMQYLETRVAPWRRGSDPASSRGRRRR